MKYIKRKPLHDKCEHIIHEYSAGGSRYSIHCWNPAKAQRFFDNPKAKPMVLCGIHANQAKRRGLDVRYIG